MFMSDHDERLVAATSSCDQELEERVIIRTMIRTGGRASGIRIVHYRDHLEGCGGSIYSACYQTENSWSGKQEGRCRRIGPQLQCGREEHCWGLRYSVQSGGLCSPLFYVSCQVTRICSRHAAIVLHQGGNANDVHARAGPTEARVAAQCQIRVHQLFPR
jgi:hypothetical protein